MSESLDAWNASAAGWELEREFLWASSRELGERMVAKLDPRPGQTVLELAAGGGDTGLLAAARVGPDGRLISTDFSPEMVEYGRRRAAELGVEGIEHRVMDAQAIELPDASVDGILCRYGLMLMPDPARALAESRRVLRPGGRLVFAVWAEARSNPWASTIPRAFVELGYLEPPPAGEPGMFALADREALTALVEAAGFASPTIAEVPSTMPFGSFERWWEIVGQLSYSLRNLRATLDEEQLARAREAASAAAEAFAPGYEPPGLTLLVTANA